MFDIDRWFYTIIRIIKGHQFKVQILRDKKEKKYGNSKRLSNEAQKTVNK